MNTSSANQLLPKGFQDAKRVISIYSRVILLLLQEAWTDGLNNSVFP